MSTKWYILEEVILKENVMKVREHFKMVRKWTEEEIDKNIEDACAVRNKRDNIKWELDLSILTNSGITLERKTIHLNGNE